MKNTRSQWLLITLMGLTVCFFCPSVQYPFINFDDNVYLYNNALVKNFNLDSLKQMFLSEHTSLFSPMVILSFAFEYPLWGDTAGGYRAVNIAFHVINVVLVFFLVLRLFDNRIKAGMVGLLFALHPLRIESVVWVTERKDVLFAFFLLAAFHLYIRYLCSGRRKYHLLALLFVSMAMLAKVSAFIALPLLFLIDWQMGKKVDKASILEKIPFLLVIGLLTMTGLGVLAGSSESPSIGIWDNLANLIWIVPFMVIRFVWPFDLAIRYPFLVSEWMPALWICLMLVLLYFALSGWASKWNRQWIWGGCFFLVGLIPVTGVMWRGFPIADRYSYLPSIGLALMLVEALSGIWTRAKNKKMLFVWVGLPLLAWMSVIVFAFWTYLAVWKNSLSLWTHVIETYPASNVSYGNRAIAWTDRGENEKALADFTRSIELFPNLVTGYWNRGLLYEKMGDYDRADQDLFAAVLADFHWYFPKLIRLTLERKLQNGLERVTTIGNELGRYRQDDAYHYLMALLFYKNENWEKAKTHIDKALVLQPDVKLYRDLEIDIVGQKK